jgi:hypothetical protein
MIVTNSTITNNNAPVGGGFGGVSTISIINTIIADNSGADCDGFTQVIWEIISIPDGMLLDPANGSLPNTNPLLGSLQYNGGPTWTHALL